LVVPERGRLHVLLAERLFHPDLTPRQRILSFEHYWNIYEDETPLAPGAVFYRYAAVAGPLEARLERLCVEAFHAVGGDSYSRIDLRMDDAGNAFVLEVNANCGLSSDPTQSSAGQLCRIKRCPFERLLTAILDQALAKAGARCSM